MEKLPSATPVSAVAIVSSNESQPVVIHGQALPFNQDIGTCRGCGEDFMRPPGIHDGVAQYYR